MTVFWVKRLAFRSYHNKKILPLKPMLGKVINNYKGASPPRGSLLNVNYSSNFKVKNTSLIEIVRLTVLLIWRSNGVRSLRSTFSLEDDMPLLLKTVYKPLFNLREPFFQYSMPPYCAANLTSTFPESENAEPVYGKLFDISEYSMLSL